MTSTAAVGDAPWWEPLVFFLVRVVLGTGIFAMITAPVICLDLLIGKVLEPQGVSVAILICVISVKYAIFAVDLLLFLVFLVKETWRSAERLWQ